MAKRIRMSPTTRKGIALAIGALCACAVGVVLAVGRGGDDTGLRAATVADSQQAGAGPEQPSASGDALARFRSCLEDQGVTLPQRGQRPPMPSDRRREAYEACRRYLPRLPFGDDERSVGPPRGTAPPSEGRDDDRGAGGIF